jgi:Tol biopolymer transport system component
MNMGKTWARFVLFAAGGIVLCAGSSAPAAETSAALLPTPAKPAAVHYLADPAISPDGSEIAFACGGDIWTVPAGGGDAHLLIAHAGYASRPLYSPDGRRLAFISSSTGNGDIYVLSLDSGALQRLSFDDAPEQLDAWSPDSRWIYYSTSGHDIASMSDVYRINSEGGTPMPVVADRFANDADAAPHPDGTTVAFCAGGYSAHWWRRGHSHLEESDIWLMRQPADSKPTFTRLTEAGAKHQWPMWSSDGRCLYYVCDRGGVANIWSLTTGGKPRQITAFTDGRVLWPTLSHDGKTLVFERDFGVWKLNVDAGKSVGAPSRVPIRLRGATRIPNVAHETYDHGVSELALSPDGKKMAFVIHGQIFATPADGGAATRVTWTDALETHPAWAHDSRRLVYLSNRDGSRHLYLYDFSTRREQRLTSGGGDEGRAMFSHNDELLAFHRNGNEIGLIELATGKERSLAKGLAFDQPPFDNVRAELAWSPGDTFLAYVSAGPQGFNNIHVVSTRIESKPRQVSFLPNCGNNSLCWSPFGSFLLFGSGQRTEPYQLAKIDLIDRTPTFQEDQFRELFKDTTTSFPARPVPPPSKPQTRPSSQPVVTIAPKFNRAPTINFNGIDQRVTLMPVGMEVNDLALSPDGKTVAFLARSGGRKNVFIYPLDAREAVPRQVTASGGNKSEVQFRPETIDGKPGSRSVYYVLNGEIHSVSPDGADHAVAIRAELDIDFDREKLAIFNQAWTALRDHFHDRQFNGVDWNKVRERYTPLIAGAKHRREVRRLLNLMVGELNASHLGVMATDEDSTTAAGRLGLEFDRLAYERDAVLHITRVIPMGPAAISGVEPDSYLYSINDTVIGPHTNLDELLEHKIAHEIVLGLSRNAKGTDIQKKRLLPISYREEKLLLYRDWVASRRNYVKKISNGRLGYVHLADMTESALARLYVDLNSETYELDGVVVDVRNNNGGFVNGYAMDVFARRNYIRLSERGFPTTTGRAQLGQRFLGLPTILVTNRHTLSDGEDFTEGYQAQHLGTTIGEPTAGWIIFTSAIRLLDDSLFRIPASTVTDHNGKIMEMHPRPVDIAVASPVGESYTSQDVQLKAAVEELTKQVETARFDEAMEQAFREAFGR